MYLIFYYDIHPQISKAEISLPLIEGKKASKISDYPPRIYITQSSDAGSEPLVLNVIGLDKKCTFEIPIPSMFYIAWLKSQFFS